MHSMMDVCYLHQLLTVRYPMPGSLHIHTSYSLWTPLTQPHWIAVLAHSNTELLRVFNSFVKQNSELFSLTISIPQIGSTVCAVCIYTKWFPIFSVSKTGSVQKILLYAYTNILSYLYHVFSIAVFIKKKKSLYVFLFIFTLKWNGKSCRCKEFLLAKYIIYFGSINQRAVMLQNMGSPLRNIPSGGIEVQYIIPAVSNK